MVKVDEGIMIMKAATLTSNLLACVIALFASSSFMAYGQSPVSADEARAIAEEAYVFGFASVEHYKAVWAYGVEPKSPKYAGFNVIRNETRLYGPDDTAVVSANNDTLYSSALMDLRAEPVVLVVPNVPNR